MESVKEVVVAFLAIFCEMGKQMFLSLKTDSETFRGIQDAKFDEESEGHVLD